ncbi:MAG: hypothetical protein WCD36_10810, partial [Rhodanobacteraceae bacterium]
MDRIVAKDKSGKRKWMIYSILIVTVVTLGFWASLRYAVTEPAWSPVVKRDVSRLVSGRAVT